MISDWFKTKKPHKLTPRLEVAADAPAAAPQKYDAVVVGAGPAGATTAYFMARDGLDVLLLERGPFPGAKMCGGAGIIADQVHKLFPNFWEELPYERIVTRLEYWLLSEDSAVTSGYTSERLATAPFNRITITRKNLYTWLCAKALCAGADLRLSHTVAEVLMDGGQAVGVRVSPPQDATFLADVVILADGANSLLAEQAGLAPRVSPRNLSLYAKETIALPPETIEDRFNLPPGQGAIIGLIGHPTAGLNGTASLHTFKGSININAGLTISSFAKGGFNPSELLDRIKKHPRIQPLLAGGVTTEYGASVIPEGGYHAIPPLVHPGLLIIGDAGSLVNGTHGINLAMWSGFYAAKAAYEAKKSRDFSARKLSLYRTLLDESFILQNLRANAKAAALQRDLPYLFDLYSRMANEAAFHLSSVYTMPIKDKRKFIWRKLTSMQPVGKILSDAWRVLKVVKG
jgi:electron transfer flavoprotein-quinone oxidoreductase